MEKKLKLVSSARAWLELGWLGSARKPNEKPKPPFQLVAEMSQAELAREPLVLACEPKPLCVYIDYFILYGVIICQLQIYH